MDALLTLFFAGVMGDGRIIFCSFFANFLGTLLLLIILFGGFMRDGGIAAYLMVSGAVLLLLY